MQTNPNSAGEEGSALMSDTFKIYIKLQGEKVCLIKRTLVILS